MKGKSLAILAGAVVILGAFIWFVERHQLTTEEATVFQARLFGSLEEETVVHLEISNVHGHFNFRRQASGWRLTAPIEMDADQAAVDAALRSLVQLDCDRTLDSGEIKPETYGLDHPSATITLGTSNGQTYRLQVGDPTPLDSRRAVALDSKSILLTSGKFFSAVNNDLDSWRSKEVVNVSLDQLAAITLRTGSGTVEAINLGDAWHLRSPVNDRADRVHLQHLMTGLTGLKVESFGDSDADLSAMGLLDPRTSVLLISADGSSGVTLDFGATRQLDGATQVACRRNDTDVFWVTDRAANALGKAPVLWRDPTVLAVNSWEVASLDLTEGSNTTQLRKESGLWRFLDGTEANGENVQERLGALVELKAVNFDLMNIGTPELGRAVIGLEGGGEPLTAVFFDPLETGGDILVTASDRDTVMSVAPADVDLIFGDVQALNIVDPQTTPLSEDQNGTP